MKYLFLILGAFALTGCASNGYNPITGQTTQPGTYAFIVNDEGVRIEASTIKGGPQVQYSKTPDGAVVLDISPSNEYAIDAILGLVGE